MINTANYHLVLANSTSYDFRAQSVDSRSTISFQLQDNEHFEELQALWCKVSARIMAQLTESVKQSPLQEHENQLRLQAQAALDYYSSVEATEERSEWQAGDFDVDGD
jgi:hypothetical protein